MPNATKHEQAIFWLDDSDDPGYALVEIIKPTQRSIMGQLYRIHILEILKPSFNKVKVGSTREVVEKLLVRGVDIDSVRKSGIRR
ncbi:MAG: hypothetical protein MN733_00855 [Nitrososphaera sp.]|nr:hypothetical protein [Nitrososphaera sp.]